MNAARHQIIKEMHSNVMKFIFNEMKGWDNWNHIIFNDGIRKFCYYYSFHEPVMNSYYANSLCVVDSYEHYDTDTTNRVEGLLENIKEMSGRSILTVQILVRSVFILVKPFQLKSSKEWKESIKTKILSLEDQSN